MGRIRLSKLKIYLVVILIGMALTAFLMWGPPGLLARSETPEFCASCHVMEPQYETWFHGGAHHVIRCVDCHLPHQNIASHYLWKSIDGLKDVLVFYSGTVPEHIGASDHAKGVLQSNCIRCHRTTVEMIDDGRRCWSCHRRMAHVRSGNIMTK